MPEKEKSEELEWKLVEVPTETALVFNKGNKTLNTQEAILELLNVVSRLERQLIG